MSQPTEAVSSGERLPGRKRLRGLAPAWNLSLLARFSLFAFFFSAVLAVALSAALQFQLEQNALRQEAETAAEQVSAVLRPNLHGADMAQPLAADRLAQIDALIRQYVLQGHTVRVKVWGPGGLLVYSDDRQLIGQRFPVSAELAQALAGTIATDISTLDKPENVAEQGQYQRLMEVYVPLRLDGSTQAVGAFEIYQDLAALEPSLAAMRRLVWLSVGAGSILLYASLFLLVRNASRELVQRNVENQQLYGEAQRQLREAERAEAQRRASEARLAGLLEVAADAIIDVDPHQRIAGFNQGAERIFGYTASEIVGQPLAVLLPRQSGAQPPEAARTSGESLLAFGRRQDGSSFPAEARFSRLGPDGTAALTVMLRDVTEREQAQAERERLLLNERTGRQLAEALGRVSLAMNATLDLPELLDLICRESASLFQVQTAFVWLVVGADLLGFAGHGQGREQWLGRRVALADPITLGPRVIRERRPIYVNDVPAAIRANEINADLVRIFHIRSILGVPLLKGERSVGALILIDTQQPGRFNETHVQTAKLFASHAATAVDNARLFDETRRRLADLEAVNRISVALRTAQTLDTMLPQLMDITLAVVHTEAGTILLHDPDSDRLLWSVARGWCAQLAPIPIEPGEGIAGRVFASGQTYVSADVATDPATHAELRPQMAPGWGAAGIAIHTATEIVGVLFVYVPAPRELTPQEIDLLTTIAEIAGNTIHRMRLYEQTEARLKRLDALRTIDKSISASLDLRLTLDVLLAQITGQLRVDAAAILLRNPAAQTLEYNAGHGFRTAALQHTHLQLGEGYAGRAAAERRIVHVADLRPRSTDFLRSPAFAAEQFVSYYAVPLIAKGEVRGVLEVYHRSLLAADPEWLNFLDTLAGQAAIAIDNAVLFENLQRSNVEIAMAYNATIEGWSHALELRDEATQGHTRRVTDMTLQLARALGMDESQLVHVRRGALLHDIGKMGIPDHILRKPAPLTEDEWVIMRRHPGYAYDMLSSIDYLRPALDIPYCHHERWDGAGYPRGLKGEQIPLAARIFSVADVWDALHSERPYRTAWSEEKVLDYIQGQSGVQLDPQVVEAFVRMMRERGAG